MQNSRKKVIEYAGLPGSGKTTAVTQTWPRAEDYDVHFAELSPIMLLRWFLKAGAIALAFLFNTKSSLLLLRSGLRGNVKFHNIYNAILLVGDIARSRKNLTIFDQGLVQLMVCERVVSNRCVLFEFEQNLFSLIEHLDYCVYVINVDENTFFERAKKRKTRTNTRLPITSKTYKSYNQSLADVHIQSKGRLRFEFL